MDVPTKNRFEVYMEKYLFEMPERSAALCLADNVSLAQVSEIAAHYAKRGEQCLERFVSFLLDNLHNHN